MIADPHSQNEVDTDHHCRQRHVDDAATNDHVDVQELVTHDGKRESGRHDDGEEPGNLDRDERRAPGAGQLVEQHERRRSERDAPQNPFCLITSLRVRRHA